MQALRNGLRLGGRQLDNEGNPPLFEAAMHNREIQMKQLLDNGANVNFKNDRNITAIAIVSKTNYLINEPPSGITLQWQ